MESKSNHMMFSLPRSGSTWVGERMKNYGVNLIDEPFRTSLGNVENPFYHSKVLTSADYVDDEFWEKLDPVTKAKIDTIGKLNDTPNIFLKETNNVFQIDFLKQLLPDVEFLFLQRHLGGVLNSILKTKDSWKNWSFDDRVPILKESLITETEKKVKSSDPFVHKCVSEYQERIEKFLKIYERAEGVKIQGSHKNALILAYLAVITLEGRSRVHRIINYEDLAINGIPNDILLGRTVENDMKKLESPGGTYSTHSTRNPSQPYAWRTSMESEALDAMSEILGKYTEVLCPNVDSSLIEGAGNIPEMSLLKVGDGYSHISNRPVSGKEFEVFIAEMKEGGVTHKELFEKLSFKPSSTHNMMKSNGTYSAKHPEKPITHISPLSALAYAVFYGYSLPLQKAYKCLQSEVSDFSISLGNTNYDDFGHLRRIGERPQVKGFIDLFGNISELAMDKGGDFYKVGGSYKDPESRLPLDFSQPTPWFQRDTETGFRLGSPHGSVKKGRKKKVMKIIKKESCPNEIQKQLLELSSK